MAEHALGFYAKAELYADSLQTVGKHLPSHRDAVIQIDKLRRMVVKHMNKFTVEFILSTPADKRRKMEGKSFHQLSQQGKQVDDVMRRVFREHMTIDGFKGAPSPSARRAIGRFAQKAIQNFNKNINQVTRQKLLAEGFQFKHLQK